MRLDVHEAAAEELLGPLDGEGLDRVGRRAALIVTAARIALGIFVGEHRSLRFEHRSANDVFRSDQLDLRLLAEQLGLDPRIDRGIGSGDAVAEKARRHAVIEVVIEFGGTGHQSDSCRIWDN